jgi:Flp pilus assembly pilin Flp
MPVYNFKTFHKMTQKNGTERGGAALEYILVSIFGLLLSVATITFVSDAIQKKLDTIEERVGVKFDASSINPFKSESE